MGGSHELGAARESALRDLAGTGLRRALGGTGQARHSPLEPGEVRLWFVFRRTRLRRDGACRESRDLRAGSTEGLAHLACPQLSAPDVRRAGAQSRWTQLDDEAGAARLEQIAE